MQETWKKYVYPFIEDKKQDVEEDSYHRHIENQLMLLGCEPIWDSNPSAKDKAIGLYYKTELTEPKRLEETLEWMVQQTIVFYNVFSSEVKEIK